LAGMGVAVVASMTVFALTSRRRLAESDRLRDLG
jgi:hypothetical protein